MAPGGAAKDGTRPTRSGVALGPRAPIASPGGPPRARREGERRSKPIRRGLARCLATAALGLAALAAASPSRPALAQQAHDAAELPPDFQVDPFWPKPLPNNWIIGQVAGVAVDRRDHVWIVHRPRCFLMQIGRAGASRGSNDTANLNRPADTEVDTAARELYVADGYGNRRIVVFDSETGAYKRHWGAYGERPHDDPLPAYDPAQPPSRSFGSPVHCVRLTRDGLVHVCDRVNNRIQVFRRDGSFVREFHIARETRLNGAVADLVPSPDAEQRFLYSVDNSNSEARVIRRADGRVLSTFGRMGRYAGQFMVPHNIAADSQGNIYVSEVDTGQRVQRFRRADPQR